MNRRTFAKGIFTTSATFMMANLSIYAVGSVFKNLDGSLVAGAKHVVCDPPVYDGSNGGTAWGSCGLCPPACPTGGDFDGTVDSNCAPYPGYTCGTMYCFCYWVP